jgi:hypothetical protein
LLSIHQKNPSCATWWSQGRKIISGPGLKRKGLGKGVVATGFVTDRELVTLYKNALAYVMPSLGGGLWDPTFGSNGDRNTSVICSKAGSLPEVAGKAALIF